LHRRRRPAPAPFPPTPPARPQPTPSTSFACSFCAPKAYVLYEYGQCIIKFERTWEAAMTLRMPELDQAVLARRAAIVQALRAIVPGEGIIASEAAMKPYETDALTAYRTLPMVVVLPETTEQVSAVLRYCHAEGIKVVPRGAGTSLSGGALP